MNIESAVLYGCWGYESNQKDETEHYCNMCEQCYDKVVTFIEGLGGRVRKLNYFTGEEEVG